MGLVAFAAFVIICRGAALAEPSEVLTTFLLLLFAFFLVGLANYVPTFGDVMVSPAVNFALFREVSFIFVEIWAL